MEKAHSQSTWAMIQLGLSTIMTDAMAVGLSHLRELPHD
jgi:hypothetical protein